MKGWLKDYPTLAASAALGQFLILVTGLIVCARLLLGLTFPAGYDAWLMLLFGLATTNVAGMIGKRLSDFRYKAAGTSPVNVEGPSNVTVEAPVPAAAAAGASGESNGSRAPVLTRQDAERAAAAYAGAAEPRKTDDESGP